MVFVPLENDLEALLEGYVARVAYPQLMRAQGREFYDYQSNLRDKSPHPDSLEYDSGDPVVAYALSRFCRLSDGWLSRVRKELQIHLMENVPELFHRRLGCGST